jgi:chromosome segregation protein
MLKRLELVGFKSFADKTTFEFSAGLTAIVGPNGSGKSNIIDAIRWTLGEQSAKSLRGGEMADVIFNGSTSRRPLSMAEVTMTLDNSRGLLATDAAEVQITRRVHRDGTGEYLLNQRPCRLKDIKDLFLGSGAGAGAYAIIEQGRVEVLLQASTKERRSLFEEAAGISRFRARKVEALRKLERVDLDLARLRDIAEEVHKQLRSVQLQAAKAQRYQEYYQRLRSLRLGLALRDYHQWRQELAEVLDALTSLRQELEVRSQQVHQAEAEVRRCEEALAASEVEVQQQEVRLAQARERIQASQTTFAHEADLTGELEEELARTRTRWAQSQARLAELTQTVAQAQQERHAAEAQAAVWRQRVQARQRTLEALSQQVATLTRQLEQDKEAHLESMRQLARWQNEVVAYQAQRDNLRREEARLRHKQAQVTESLAALDLELTQLEHAERQLQQHLTASRQRLTEWRQQAEHLRQQIEAAGDQLSAWRQQRSAWLSRLEVLDGLERSYEGLAAGVREVLTLLQEPASPWRQALVGMIADCLQVPREHAPLMDLALGERAQRFLVRDWELLYTLLAQRTQPFSSRVGFIPLPSQGYSVPAPEATLAAHPGIVARADQFVRCEVPELAHLPAYLLGQTWIVRDLTTARALASHAPGCRFLTLQGELLDGEGTLTVGSQRAEAGILSRKSELRELRRQLAALEEQLAAGEQSWNQLREQLTQVMRQTAAQEEEVEVLTEQAADLRARLEQHGQRRQGLREEATLGEDELRHLEKDLQEVEARGQQAQAEVAAAEQRVQELMARLAAAEQALRQAEQQRQVQQQEGTADQVALAKAEERLAALRRRQEQLEADLAQRQRDSAEAQQGLHACRVRLAESQQTMLAASADLAQWYLDKEEAERRLQELRTLREQLRQQRSRLLAQLEALRNQWQAHQEEVHTYELQASDRRHRCDALVQRLQEEYQVDLAELYARYQAARPAAPAAPEAAADAETCAPTELSTPAPTGETPLADAGDLPPIPDLENLSPEQAQAEIAELRQKLARLGHVNLDALQELGELETRAAHLEAQLADLTKAKRSLEEIIARINEDSRRLFLESFNAIRGHFQELFRKLFGGGMADIVLEDEKDVLECGIEIVARPPGKELRSLSLLSGGEKTLTAVALLLAIFRSKPSPFCVLDEVDAALDDANIGRFTAVLREFLDRSQFILVTHSKRTMAAADVLYGITMQESGVSKKVAVRFEDWPDEGAPASNGVASSASTEFSGK